MSTHHEKYTAYGLFIEALWAQHKMKYSEQQIKQEIAEFNRSCSKWWYELPQQEKSKYQKIANELNGSPSSDIQAPSPSPFEIPMNTAKVQKPSPATASEMSINGDQIENHSLSSLKKMTIKSNLDQNDEDSDSSDNSEFLEIVLPTKTKTKSSGKNKKDPNAPEKPKKDPNAPKKPLSTFLLFSSDERKNIKKEFRNKISVTDMGKELGQRWKDLDPMVKQDYEEKYKNAKEKYEKDMLAYMPETKRNKPKQKSNGYIFFCKQEREKVKSQNPNWSIADIGKELGLRWSKLDAESKKKFKEMAQKENEAAGEN